MASKIPQQQICDALDFLKANYEGYSFRHKRIGVSAGDCDDLAPLGRIEMFRTSIANGVLPDAKTLFFVAHCFAKYIESGGNMNLDKAFGVPGKKRVGSPSQQAKSKRTEEAYLYQMLELRRENPTLTILEAARKAFDGPMNDKAESYCEMMANYYSRDGWTQLEPIKTKI
jgi:hypothetical protein